MRFAFPEDGSRVGGGGVVEAGEATDVVGELPSGMGVGGEDTGDSAGEAIDVEGGGETIGDAREGTNEAGEGIGVRREETGKVGELIVAAGKYGDGKVG